MTKTQKNEAIELLKDKFSQYNNFYLTDSSSLSVAQINKLRRVCFEKQVEMKVAKNSLVQKALEALNSDKYAGVYEALHGQTAIMFSENPKEPAVIISAFRKDTNGERPVLKAAFIDTDVFVGDEQLTALSQLKTKNELIGEIIGLLQSPAQNVVSALQSGGNKLAGLLKTLEERAQ
ncbi:50S ribosomal protein L10 [Compostibacter hankyongensis]|uniref:Large ribosomal subunit protein uL10 n=1 Tax=Compostibacter hankyongensis TaxID=1007089 RepID=A0ABP8FHG4_9BACT